MSRSSTLIFSASAIFARMSWTLTRPRRPCARILVELLLVLLELLLRHAAAHVLLDELAQHVLGLGGDQALRQRETRPAPPSASVTWRRWAARFSCSFALEVRCGPAVLRASRLSTWLALKKASSSGGQHALAHFLHLDGVDRRSCPPAPARRRNRPGKSPARLLVARLEPASCGRARDEALVRPRPPPRSAGPCRRSACRRDLGDRLAVDRALVGQLDVVALLRGALGDLEIGALLAQALDHGVDLGSVGSVDRGAPGWAARV
jgi:hypothetical protein